MTRYADQFNTTRTPQSEKIPGSTQVANSAGGFAWAVNDWTRLDRFLILGNEGGSYYASERKLTIENAEGALRCLASDGERFVKRVVEISTNGRAPKNDPAIFLLALAAKKGDAWTRRCALEALSDVCRIGTHLFQFIDACESFGGWGRGLRRAVGKWYTDKPADKLAYQLVKYRQRGGWTHRDALRLAKPAAGDVAALQWAVGKPVEGMVPDHIIGYQRMQAATSPKDVVRTLADHPSLPWETIPSEHLAALRVWEALLPNLPMTALVRNLGRMTANGLLKPMSDAEGIVIERLRNRARIQKARLHPIALLSALCTYKQGHGMRGSLTWQAVPRIVDALDEAFYLAFDNVVPTGKRTLLALDVSGSMTLSRIAGMPGLTPRVGSAAMAMVTARTESNWGVVAFSREMVPVSISPRQRLDDIMRATDALPFGGTDCAQPMLWALKHKIQADVFVVYTDSETWAGSVHPVQALAQYRKATGIPAKLVVVGMVSNGFTIADPNDAGMMDVVGFDTAAPSVIADFARS